MKTTLIPWFRCVLVLSVASAGCVTPMRASNRSAAPNESASVRFPGTVDEALAWLAPAFKAEGYRVVHMVDGRVTDE